MPRGSRMRAGGVLQSERDALPLMLALAAEGSLVAGPVEKIAMRGPRPAAELLLRVQP